MVHAMINGIAVEVKEKTTILEAANQYDIEIPTLCHMKDLVSEGVCRICMVEIKGHSRLAAACSTYLAEGNVIETESEKVVASRVSTLDLMLSNHDKHCFDCVTRDICKLKAYCDRYHLEESTFPKDTPNLPVDDTNPYLVYDPNLCIMCHRCINTCRQLNGKGAIEAVYHGYQAVVSPVHGIDWAESECDSCGNCAEHCPTGALRTKNKENYLMKDVCAVQTTCTKCGLGCQMKLMIKDERVVDIMSADGMANRGLLCVKGRFENQILFGSGGIQQPMVRKNGILQKVDWDEALQTVTDRISDIKQTYGVNTIAGCAMSNCTNEEYYLFQKFFRAGIGTNNIYHSSYLYSDAVDSGLRVTLGTAMMTNPVWDVRTADVILLAGTDVIKSNPVFSMLIRQAVQDGKKLILIDTHDNELREFAKVFLKIVPGTGVALIHTMLHVILKENMENKDFIAFHTEGFDELRETVRDYDPKKGEKITGVPRKMIITAARLFASASESYIAYTPDIADIADRCSMVMSMSNLAMITGNIGRTGAGINRLVKGANTVGACDMGCLPDCLPGDQRVYDKNQRSLFEAAWSVKLNDQTGLPSKRLKASAQNGAIKMLYVMAGGMTDEQTDWLRKCKEKEVFLVIQDSCESEWSELADVILPSAGFAQKEGTITSSERRVQLLRTAVPLHGSSKQGWEILMKLMNNMGYTCSYSSTEDIFSEIRSVIPDYSGISYREIEKKKGICRPYDKSALSDSPVLHVNGPARRDGTGLFRAADWTARTEMNDAEYPYTLMTSDMLYHYKTRMISRRNEMNYPYMSYTNYIELNRDDIASNDLYPGEWVKVSSKNGSVVCEVHVEDSLAKYIAWMPDFAFGEMAETGSIQTDKEILMKGYRQMQIRIEKISESMRNEIIKNIMNAKKF